MVAELTVDAAPPFAAYHKWDRNFFLVLVGLMWLGILGGFVPEVVRHVTQHKPPFPLIVHVHGAVFAGWMVLLTAQVLLIRRRRPDLHRKLGTAAMGLAALMVVIGPATAIYMQRYHWGTPKSDVAFLAVQLTDILAFAGLASAGFALRGDSSAHKRLMLIATLYITDAGFARLFGDGLQSVLGDGFWPFLVEAYLANDVLLAALGAYDLVTRRRLHPAYVAGVAWTLAFQIAGSWLDHSPAWKPVALTLIGH